MEPQGRDCSTQDTGAPSPAQGPGAGESTRGACASVNSPGARRAGVRTEPARGREERAGDADSVASLPSAPPPCSTQAQGAPGPCPHSTEHPAPHQQQLVAFAESCLLGEGARLDRVDEAAAGVAPNQGELGDEAVAIQCCVLHRGSGAPHVPHGCDRGPEGSGVRK